MADDELLSITDAARLWGVSERTAYRRAVKLSEGSDRVSEGGRVFVRRSAIVATVKPGEVSEGGERISDRVSESVGTFGEPVGSVSEDKAVGGEEFPTGVGSPGEASGELLALRDLVTRQDSEIAFLRESLQREQAIAMTATSDASELRRKLEALTDGLIEASSVRNPMHGTETGKSHAVPPGENVQERPETSTDSRKTTETAGFWGRVRALFGGGDR